MRRTVYFLVLFLTMIFSWIPGFTSFASDGISDYRVIFKPYRDSAGSVNIAIREYYQNDTQYLLTVDTTTFKTKVAASTEIDFKTPVPEYVLKNTPLVRTLAKHTAEPFPLDNDGVRGADSPVEGWFLTVDMCPSLREMEKGFFERVMSLPQSKNGPVPVGIALTGVWANNHQAELQWLRDQETAGRLEITWINHSYSHPYDSRQPYSKTFLLTPGVNFRHEVLAMEELMLSKGIKPSPFFRFPGLISDQSLIETLREMSLIPLGSNAWLAKGETPRPGSIVLVHGNGNEPREIELWFGLLAKYRHDWEIGNLRWLPLGQAFTKTIQN